MAQLATQDDDPAADRRRVTTEDVMRAIGAPGWDLFRDHLGAQRERLSRGGARATLAKRRDAEEFRRPLAY